MVTISKITLYELKKQLEFPQLAEVVEYLENNYGPNSGKITYSIFDQEVLFGVKEENDENNKKILPSEINDFHYSCNSKIELNCEFCKYCGNSNLKS
ncbi:MAG: hypothetical protein HeimC3_16210 [Candidatus Heimdallarchaeota archaeon LC_3]|nr:MAG: hypothetical protein HeimC3_16210 [Candidatus Heimdallarchaeota archaeon LC_3]